MVWHQGENHDWYMQHCHVKPIKYVTLLMPAMDDNITNHDTLLSPQCRAYCVLHNNPGETPLVTNNSIYIHIRISKYFLFLWQHHAITNYCLLRISHTNQQSVAFPLPGCSIYLKWIMPVVLSSETICRIVYWLRLLFAFKIDLHNSKILNAVLKENNG